MILLNYISAIRYMTESLFFSSKLETLSILAFNLINVYINCNLLVTCSAEAFQRKIINANMLLFTSP